MHEEERKTSMKRREDDYIPYYTAPISQGKVVKVYDGDTITIVADAPTAIPGKTGLFRFRIRLDGINCPERRSHDLTERDLAFTARDFVAERIEHKTVRIETKGYDKYGRVLAKVYYKPGEEQEQEQEQGESDIVGTRKGDTTTTTVQGETGSTGKGEEEKKQLEPRPNDSDGGYTCINELLLKRCLAVPYKGGRKIVPRPCWSTYYKMGNMKK